MRVPKIILLWRLLFAAVLVLSGCSGAKQQKLASLQAYIEDKKALLEEKEATLAAAQKKQGVLRNLFKDTPEVNTLQTDVAKRKKEIKVAQKEIRKIQSRWKMSIVFGFFISLVAVIILVVVSEGAILGDNPDCAAFTFLFLIFWFLFSVAIRWIFF